MFQAPSTLAAHARIGLEPGDRASPVASGAAPRFSFPDWVKLSTWRGRLFWLVVLFGPLWLLDKPFYDLRFHERKILVLGDIRDVTRQFGEPMGIAWMALVIWSLDPARRRLLLIAVVATIIAATCSSVAKLMVGRERPKVSDGWTVVHGPHWPGSMNPDTSLPSGHTAVAFAFAYGLGQMYPLHRKLWLFLAAGCGASRTLGVAHFITDVLVGAWFGWELARLVWESRIGPALLAAIDRRFPHADWLPTGQSKHAVVTAA